MTQEKLSTKLQKFQNRLISMRDELLNKTPVNSMGQDDSGDEIDLAQHLIMSDMSEKLSLRDKQTVVHITEALGRIEDGTFGQCEACEEEISDKRLEALPFCKFCVFCAERTEKIARQYR